MRTGGGIDERLGPHLCCPHCQGDLAISPNGARCRDCERQFPRAPTGQLDLTLQEAVSASIDFAVTPEPAVDPDAFCPLEPKERSSIAVDDLETPPHLTAALASYVPAPAETSSDLLLDFGCGDGGYQQFCEQVGYQWVGVDIDSQQSTLLSDGHSLPFDDDSFGCVMAIAALEHVQYPQVVVAELHRVLEPGGVFIGAVAFAEGWHGGGFFHPSHYGIYSLLDTADFRIDRICPYRIKEDLPGVGWEAPVTYARDLFPGLPESVKAGLLMPVYGLHRLWYPIGTRIKLQISSDEPIEFQFPRSYSLAGQFCFVARK